MLLLSTTLSGYPPLVIDQETGVGGAGPVIIVGADGAEMVYIPDSVFFMGDNDGAVEERPRMSVFLEGFFMDRFEISNERFSKFIKETAYKPEGGFKFDSGSKNLPARRLTWKDVESYCAWAGKRLPLEYEWEKAARGVDGRKWPWGNNAKDRSKLTGVAGLVLMDEYDDPSGQSPYGCLHMADNVWEWVDDWFKGYVLNPEPAPRYGEKYKVLKGGSWWDCSFYKCGISAPVYNRSFFLRSTKNNSFGFRCAKDDGNLAETILTSGEGL